MFTSFAQLTDRQQQALEQLHQLTDAQRLDAREKARAHVIRAYGERPKRSQFADHTVSEYPRWLTLSVAAMLFVVFTAAANVSVFRVFTAGRDHYLTTMPNQNWQAAVVGVSAFVLAEFMVIASVIAARVYFQGRARWLLALPAALGLAMAFVGNAVITHPTLGLGLADLWGLLETTTPPTAVLFMALIGERLILDAVRRQHANERAYQQALAEWQQATAEPENLPGWRAAYANALREALIAANSKGRGSTARREYMQTLGAEEWRALVWRELAADNWFEDPTPDTVSHTAPNPTQAGNPPAFQEVQVTAQVATATTSRNGQNGRSNGH